MVGAPSVFAPGPGALSNRAVIEKAQSFGAVVTHRKGDIVKMLMPDGVTLELRAEHVKQGNSAKTVLSVATHLGVPWDRFALANPHEPLPQDIQLGIKDLMLDRQLDRRDLDTIKWSQVPTYLKDSVHEYALHEYRAVQKAARKAQERAEREAALSIPDPAPDVIDPPEVAAEKVAQIKRSGGITNAVFDALVRAKTPLSLELLARETGYKVTQCGGAATNLVKQGVCIRVKQGVYCAKPQYLPQEVHLTMEQAVKSPLPPEQAAAVLDSREAPVSSMRPLQEVKQSPASLDDDTVFVILDMLFPSGFRASNLPAIDRWRRATEDLMKEINGDAS